MASVLAALLAGCTPGHGGAGAGDDLAAPAAGDDGGASSGDLGSGGGGGGGGGLGAHQKAVAEALTSIWENDTPILEYQDSGYTGWVIQPDGSSAKTSTPSSCQ